MPFGYLRDPLFLASFSAYCGYRCLRIWGIDATLIQCYLNDLLCIPFWIPIMLWVQRRLGLRSHDDAPRGYEIVIPLLILAAVFEVILPVTATWQGLAVADPNDVLCYALGGLLASWFWRWRYGHGAG